MRRCLFFWIMFVPVGIALANEPLPPYNTVELNAEAQRESQNDLLSATLYVQLDDLNPASLANSLNKSLNDTLALAKTFKSIKVSSGDYQTHPIYENNQVQRGWRGRGEIHIESKDFEAATNLIGKLQNSMKLSGISLTVAPDTRRKIHNELITEAIAAFKARAEIVKTSLAGRGYKIRRISVVTDPMTSPPRYRESSGLAMTTAVAAPRIEGGTSVTSVAVSGTIEVLE